MAVHYDFLGLTFFQAIRVDKNRFFVCGASFQRLRVAAGTSQNLLGSCIFKRTRIQGVGEELLIEHTLRIP